MTAPDTETLTAALRRLADEHASGLLSVATPGRDVVLELADGVPVGIGPPHDVSDRVGGDASAELVAAAVVDGLVDRTVAAIVGGGGAWVWDVTDSATMMPVPPGLATELSRRAVDAAQALATVAPDQVLDPGRDLETHGDVDRLRDLFDGERTLAEVADLAGLTVPAAATLAAALVAAGVLTTGQEDTSPRSWTDAVAVASDADDDEDEPELWVMDPPDDEDEPDADDEQATTPAARAVDDTPTATPPPTHQPEASTAVTHEPATAPPAEAPTAADEEAGATDAPAADGDPGATDPTADDDWADTTWLDELGGSDQGTAAAAATDADEDEDADADAETSDTRATLSAMISDLQGSGRPTPPAPTTPPPTDRRSRPDTDATEGEGEDAAEERTAAEAKRKEPKAAPGEVAEFLRELSRLALDDE